MQQQSITLPEDVVAPDLGDLVVPAVLERVIPAPPHDDAWRGSLLTESTGPTIPERRVRVIALNPALPRKKRVSDLAGRPELEPAVLAQRWCDLINWGTQEQTYVIHDVIPTTTIPLVSVQGCPMTEVDVENRVSLNGDAYAGLLETDGPWPCSVNPSDPHAPSSVDLRRALFGLVPDTAALLADGTITDVWIWAPHNIGQWEAGMVANPADPARYYLHNFLLEDPRVPVGKAFVVQFLGERDDTITECFYHRAEFIMRVIFGEGGEPCFPSMPPVGWANASVHTAQTVYTLAETLDAGNFDAGTGKETLGNAGDGQIGWGHNASYSWNGYNYDYDDIVPASTIWPRYPEGFPLDLTRNDRRTYLGRLSAATPPCEPAEGFDKNKFQAGWQWRQWPKNPGLDRDGRLCNWWLYTTNVNEQTGRGLRTSAPVTGPTTGGRDVRLQANYLQDGAVWVIDSLALRWKPEEHDAGTYTLFAADASDSGFGAPYVLAERLPGVSVGVALRPPPPGATRLFAILWTAADHVTTHLSDWLSFTRLADDHARGANPPSYVASQLYQGPMPQLRYGTDAARHPDKTTVFGMLQMDGGVIGSARKRWGQQQGAMADLRASLAPRFYYAVTADNSDPAQYVVTGRSDVFGFFPGHATV